MLNLQKDGKIIAGVREGGRFTLPNGDVVSPALEGWRNEDGYEMVKAPVPEPVEPTIEDWRATAKTTRTRFVLAAKAAGLLSPEDALLAAKGGWPEAFSDALEGLPVDPTDAQIVWAAASEVHRNDPVLMALGAHLELSEEQLDALIGWP